MYPHVLNCFLPAQTTTSSVQCRVLLQKVHIVLVLVVLQSCQPVSDMQVSLLERTWRYAWRKKGDVYHLLFDMSGYVDGRVWPVQDKTDVLLFLALMHHVTGASSRLLCLSAAQQR